MTNIRTNPIDLRTSLTDDPRVVEQQLTEEYTNHVVPRSARKSRSQVLGSWSSITSAMAFLYYGALAAVLVGVQEAIIGLVLVVISYSLLGRLSVRDAIRWGLNSMLISRRLFGNKGAAITPLLIGLSLVYYAVFEGSIVAVALQSYFNVWDIRVWYAIVVVGMLPLMLGGMQTWLSKLNWVSLPIYFFGVTAAVLVAGMQVGWVGDWSAFSGGSSSAHGIPGWLTVFVLYMGIFVLFPEAQDAARFARERDLKFHQNVTFGWAFYGVACLFNGLAGIAIVGFAGSSDEVSENGVVQGIIDTLGLAGLIVIVVSQIRINSANYYFASVNLERFVAHFTRRGISRRAWVVLLSLAVFVLMLTDVFGYIATALAWQAVLMVTLVGITVTHRAFNPRQAPEFRTYRLKALGPGFTVWIVSSGVGIVLLQLPAQLPVLSALAPLISLGLAVALYSAVRLKGGSAARERRADPVREEIEDLWTVRVECDSCERSYVAQEMDVPEQGFGVQCLACQESKSRSGVEEPSLPQ